MRPSLPGFVMSSCMLFGKFAVAGASRVSSSQKVVDGVVTTFHYLYDTTISVRNGPPIQASLRVYSPPNAVPFPEQSIVFAYTKAHAPTNDTVLLDAISVFAYPGNSDDGGDQDGILDFPATFAVFTGLVRTQGEPMPSDPASRSFLVDVSEHVRDSERISPLEAVFDGHSARWTRIYPPRIRTTVHVFGHCRDLSEDGALAINIDNIAFNVGSWIQRGPSPKHRKLSAYASRNMKKTTISSTTASSSRQMVLPDAEFTPVSNMPSSSSASSSPQTIPSITSHVNPDVASLALPTVPLAEISPAPLTPVPPAAGFSTDQNEAEETMQEAVSLLSSPGQLRFLFATLLVNDCVPSPIHMWTSFRANLCQDFILRYGHDVGENHALLEIQHDLEEHEKSLTQYGLPRPIHCWRRQDTN